MLQKHSTVCGAAESARALLAFRINQNVPPYFRTAEEVPHVGFLYMLSSHYKQHAFFIS